ncbi:MAG: 4-hydroxy-3-methylbut-2-enyl diphosphate reductase [Akkermansia sp.]|nr:4-hydroxy-3-methylbut-2-enyl diphosphate reductase [Akkermansia sp.]
MTSKKTINVRRPEVMARVREKVQQYQSELVESIRANGDVLRLPSLELHLASAFGFCDGVKRAIEIAYATCSMFEGRRIWLIGEIIHNPVVNADLDVMGLRHLPWDLKSPLYDELKTDDVVIMPAFGGSVAMRRLLDEKGVNLVDSTCGNVIRVWQKVRNYARMGITSVIHGKAKHEESQATASHSQGDDGKGNYIVIFNEDDARLLCDYILGRGDKAAFMAHFASSCSEGFDPDIHLAEMGMANQTTMLKSETARIQSMLRAAVTERDGDDSRFHAFDTICGATQDRQNALFELLDKPLEAMFIIGGYNSSNTTHLAHIAARKMPVFFVESADCLLSLSRIRAFNLKEKKEVEMALPAEALQRERPWRIGVTAGASCPANVIEQVIRRLAELRGDSLPV